MKIISFAFTEKQLLAGKKTCTRRAWKDSYAARIRPGDRLQAWSKSPRRGGKRLGTIRVTVIYKERLLFPHQEATKSASQPHQTPPSHGVAVFCPSTGSHGYTHADMETARHNAELCTALFNVRDTILVALAAPFGKIILTKRRKTEIKSALKKVSKLI